MRSPAVRVERRAGDLCRGGNLGETPADPVRLQAGLARNVERLVEELESHAAAPGRLQVYLGYQTGSGNSWEVSLLAPTNQFDLLMEAGRWCLEKAWILGQAVNRMQQGLLDRAADGLAQGSCASQAAGQWAPGPIYPAERGRGKMCF
jgi:hypothetical protein